MCTLSSSPPDVHTPHTPHTCTPHTVRLSDGRTLRATDLLAVSSLLGCWDQPRKLHVCPGRYGIVVGSRVRGRSRDARPGVSSLYLFTCYLLHLLRPAPTRNLRAPGPARPPTRPAPDHGRHPPRHHLHRLCLGGLLLHAWGGTVIGVKQGFTFHPRCGSRTSAAIYAAALPGTCAWLQALAGAQSSTF